MQYYAPVPQVDSGHQRHLGAGVVLHLQVLEVHQHLLHLKEKNSATVHFNCCNSHILCQIFIAQKYLFDIELGQDHEDLQACEEVPEGGQRDSVHCNSTLVH